MIIKNIDRAHHGSSAVQQAEKLQSSSHGFESSLILVPILAVDRDRHHYMIDFCLVTCDTALCRTGQPRASEITLLILVLLIDLRDADTMVLTKSQKRRAPCDHIQHMHFTICG